MALRLLRILPASEAVSLLLNRGGGAKSRAVKVPDFLSKCLRSVVSKTDLIYEPTNLRAGHDSKVIKGRGKR